MKMGHARWMLDRDITLPAQIECVVVAQDEMEKEFVCLCLVPDKSNHYKRVGLCQ